MPEERPDLPRNKNNALKFFIGLFLAFLVFMAVFFYYSEYTHDQQAQQPAAQESSERQ